VEPAAVANPLNILLVSTADIGGGAELSAWNLFTEYRNRGHNSWLAVGRKRRTGSAFDPYVVSLPNDANRTAWARFWLRGAGALDPFARQRVVRRLPYLLRWIGEPRRQLEVARGYEDFNYPATWQLPGLTKSADLIHCYNLHGEYFDLRALPWLSQQRPVVLDLRDAWLLSGHCAHSLDCERWRSGCGQCPYLTVYPAVKRDATAFNWSRKREIFSRSRVYVATPSHWLMRKVEQSILATAIIESRVIPTGVDLSVFHPSEKRRIRAELELPQDARILLFAANGIRRNIWKDYGTLRGAIGLLSERLSGRHLLCLALGENAPSEQIGDAQIRFVPHLKDPGAVARYFQASDLYVHAAAADTFPRAILEALACGTPVVATSVGGIPEQVTSLENGTASNVRPNGMVVPYQDAGAMASAIEKILTDEALRLRLSENSAADARNRFDLAKQASSYLDWYRELLQPRPS
jgi:glycosyltransferase involved in cell wall biosynthesis